MRTIALLLACQLAQEEDVEQAVSRLVDRLSADEVEVRDRATKELAALGMRAVPFLRRRSETGDAEVRERLLGVAREIERQDRLRYFLGGEHPIRIKAERLPLGELLAELARQNPTPVVLNGVPEGERVTVEIDGARFFDALRRICLAHGGIVIRLPRVTYQVEDHAPVELLKGDPRACHPFIEGPFVVNLEDVYLTESWDFGDRRGKSATLDIDVGWERGTRPIGMKLEVDSVVDDEGTVYKVTSNSSRDDSNEVHFWWRRIWVNLDKAPPASVTAFRRISGTVVFRFPSDGHVARLERPLEQKGVDAGVGPASFRFEEMVREGGDSVRASLESGWSRSEVYGERVQFLAVDGKGRIYPAQGGQGKSTSPDRMRWTLPFEIPEDCDVKELRAVKLKLEKDKLVRRKIEWKFENVRFR